LHFHCTFADRSLVTILQLHYELQGIPAGALQLG
jgi:hypothetical protein